MVYKGNALSKKIKQSYKSLLKAWYETWTNSLTHNEGPAIYISEPGLYQLIFSSRLELADQFCSWVFEKALSNAIWEFQRRGVSQHGKEWFCGRDVCDILVYEKYHDALSKKVRQSYKSPLKALCEMWTTSLTHNDCTSHYPWSRLGIRIWYVV